MTDRKGLTMKGLYEILAVGFFVAAGLQGAGAVIAIIAGWFGRSSAFITVTEMEAGSAFCAVVGQLVYKISQQVKE